MRIMNDNNSNKRCLVAEEHTMVLYDDIDRKHEK
jgi:hypothetical protein